MTQTNGKNIYKNITADKSIYGIEKIANLSDGVV